MSAATFWRNRTAVPHWDTKIDIRLIDGKRYVEAFAVNRGRGGAREAKLSADASDLMANMGADRSPLVPFGERLVVTLIYGPESHGKGTFVLTWRQEPNLKKLRTKRLRFKLKALPDPTTRRGRRR